MLNGWVCTGNCFERNDASYANNIGFEAWSPRNTYRNNKANHGSYGFWLGASDQTLLEGNEASYNGLASASRSAALSRIGPRGHRFHGPSSHTVVWGNECVGNNGAGIALIGDLDDSGPKWRLFHWIIEQNLLQGTAGASTPNRRIGSIWPTTTSKTTAKETSSATAM